MLGAAVILIFAGYSAGSYGWILLRGYDIPFRSWVSPLNPYKWPAGGPPMIPPTQILPGSPPSPADNAFGGLAAGVAGAAGAVNSAVAGGTIGGQAPGPGNAKLNTL